MEGEVEVWFCEWIGFLLGFSSPSPLFYLFFFSLLASPLHQGNGVEVWSVGVLALVCLPGEEEKERRLAVGLFLLAGKRREREEEGLAVSVERCWLWVLGVVLEEEVSALGRRKKKLGAEVVVLSF